MSERLNTKLRNREVAHDLRVSCDFVRVYCDAHHRGADRTPLASAGVAEGVYRRIPVLCVQCSELQVYAEKRRAFCPYDPKPYCSECPEHCYKEDRRNQMVDVMRYAGPRSLVHGHPIEGIKHAIAMRRNKTKLHRAQPDARGAEPPEERK